MNRYIKLDQNYVVTNVRFGSSILEDEIESSTGELGQIMQEDGTFIDPEPTPKDNLPTLEDMQMQTLLNTEYLVVMSELNSL